MGVKLFFVFVLILFFVLTLRGTVGNLFPGIHTYAFQECSLANDKIYGFFLSSSIV